MASELDKESVSFLKVLHCVASEPLGSFLYPLTWKSIGVSRTLNDFVTSFFGLLENIGLLIYAHLPNDDRFHNAVLKPMLVDSTAYLRIGRLSRGGGCQSPKAVIIT